MRKSHHTFRYILYEILFYFTVILDEARIVLLFLRESFVINFPTRDGNIFRKPTPLVFQREFRIQFTSSLKKFCNQPEDHVACARCVRETRAPSQVFLLSYRIIFRNRFVKSFGRVLRTLIFFLRQRYKLRARMARLILRASANSDPNRRWNFRELVRNPVRTNGMISKFALSNGRRCCATRKTTPELNVVSSCCRIVLLV